MNALKKYSPLIITACAVIAYSNSFRGTFLFDDYRVIFANPFASGFRREAFTSRFLVDLSFWFNLLVSGNKAADYHLVNLVVHICSGLFLYGIINRTLSIHTSWRLPEWFACACAAVWVAHPVQTSAVTYICQRYESMMGLFYLGAMYFFTRAVDSKNERLWYNLSLCFCLLGMATKEVIVTLPFMLLLYDHVFLEGTFREKLKKRSVYYAAAFGCIPALICLQVVSYGKSVDLNLNILPDTGALEYLAVQAGVMLHYIKLAFIPWPLCFDYHWPAPAGPAEILFPAVITAGVFLISAAAAWKRNPYGYAGVWFFFILAPTSSVLPSYDPVFDHRLYLSLAAPSIVTISLICRYFRVSEGDVRRDSSFRLTGPALICLMVLSCMVLTYVRNRDYRSEETIWAATVKTSPRNLRARNGLAVALSEAGRYDEALVHYRFVIDETNDVKDAVQLKAGERLVMSSRSREAVRYNAFVNLGTMRVAMGMFDDALDCFIKARNVYPYSDFLLKKIEAALRCSGLGNEEINLRMDRITDSRGHGGAL